MNIHMIIFLGYALDFLRSSGFLKNFRSSIAYIIVSESNDLDMRTLEFIHTQTNSLEILHSYKRYIQVRQANILNGIYHGTKETPTYES